MVAATPDYRQFTHRMHADRDLASPRQTGRSQMPDQGTALLQYQASAALSPASQQDAT